MWTLLSEDGVVGGNTVSGNLFLGGMLLSDDGAVARPVDYRSCKEN